MIRVPGVQGSPEWRKARIGIPTASGLENLLTATLRPSSSAQRYLYKLVAEHLLGRPLDDAENGFIDRGKELEAEGRNYYRMITDVEVEEVGFCLRDDGRFGCSPDGLIGDDGGLEIKVPSAHVHVGYMLDPQSLVLAYRAQVQGNLMVTERMQWDLMSYNPELQPVIVRVKRDEEYLEALGKVLPVFLDALDEAKRKVERKNIPDAEGEGDGGTEG